MKTRTKLAAAAVTGGLAGILFCTTFLNPKPSLTRTPTARPAVQAQEIPYTIPGTNRADPEFVKSSGLPEGEYIVKPHPYKKDSFLVVKNDSQPQFYSTTPVISNPNDGSFDAYRLLEPGENLDDVIKQGPVDRFVPPTEKLTLDTSSLEPGNYLTFIQRNDICNNILNSDGSIGGDFTVKATSESLTTNHPSTISWKRALKSGRYELHVTGNNGGSKLGTVYLDKDDEIKLYRY